MRVLALALALVFAPACSTTTPGAPALARRAVEDVDGPAAKQLVAAGATLLDVRSHGEWDAGHIEGAVHIPVGEVGRRMGELRKDRPVVVYCAAGVRAARAARELAAAGFEVKNLGGMAAWNR